MAAPDSVDSELIEGIKQRNPDALAATYDKYAGAAYSLLLRIVGNESIAEDLLQELFIRIWNRGRDYDPARGVLGVWLISIARNMAIDHIRSAQAKFQTKVRPIEDVSPLSLSSDQAHPDSVIDRSRAISSAFASLKPNEKLVVELAYFEGCSQTEIAARLQEPLGTVKSWMRSAMHRLRVANKIGAAQ